MCLKGKYMYCTAQIDGRGGGGILTNLVNPEQFAKVLPIQTYITKPQVD